MKTKREIDIILCDMCGKELPNYLGSTDSWKCVVCLNDLCRQCSASIYTEWVGDTEEGIEMCVAHLPAEVLALKPVK